MCLKFSIHHKTNKNSLKIMFLVPTVTKLYNVVTLKLNVHGKLVIAKIIFVTSFLVEGI